MIIATSLIVCSGCLKTPAEKPVRSESRKTQTRPERPDEAILGRWKSSDSSDGRVVRFFKAPNGHLDYEITYPTGAIENLSDTLQVDAQNAKTGTLKLWPVDADGE